MTDKFYVFDGIAVSLRDGEEAAIRSVERRLRNIGICSDNCKLSVYKRSVDARHRNDIKTVFSIAVSAENGYDAHFERLKELGARLVENSGLEFKLGTERMTSRPLVVGMGPAGMFCALVLAENGYRPIIIDRGDSVFNRAASVERFYSEHILDTDSNIQFGAGGAGTFSDGKLMTRINDPRCAYVLDVLTRFGAPTDIKIKAKPHIGTDILRNVVDNVLGHIQNLGGDVIYRCKLEKIVRLADGTVKAETTKGDIMCGCVVLALGHSARDTYKMLLENGFDIVPKPISVGVRIEHRRQSIEDALYGRYAGDPALGAAEYSLSDTKGDRGVYTFCMCPGGEVVAAASEVGGVVVNGMSRYARDGENSNSAVAVSIRLSDYEPVNGSLALGAIEFQRRIERRAFTVGGGDYSAPIQTVGNFMGRVSANRLTSVMPTYMNGSHFKLASMDEVFPNFVTESLRYGLNSFERKLKGFASDEAVLSGAETRTSSPLRMLRGDDMTAIGNDVVYPCGEGAGYAGGITSAAVDGIRVAIAIAERYCPFG